MFGREKMKKYENVGRTRSNLGFRSSPQSYKFLSAGPKQLEGFWLEKQRKTKGKSTLCFFFHRFSSWILVGSTYKRLGPMLRHPKKRR